MEGKTFGGPLLIKEEVEPDEDPLGGAATPPEDFTVQTIQGTATGELGSVGQTAPKTTPAFQFVNLNSLLRKPIHEETASSNTANTVNVHGGQIHGRLSTSGKGTKVSTSYIPSSTDGTSNQSMYNSNPALQNDPNLFIVPENGDPLGAPIKDEYGNSIYPQVDDSLTLPFSSSNSAQSSHAPASTSLVQQPIPVPGRHLMPIPISLLRGEASKIINSLSSVLPDLSANPRSTLSKILNPSGIKSAPPTPPVSETKLILTPGRLLATSGSNSADSVIITSAVPKTQTATNGLNGSIMTASTSTSASDHSFSVRPKRPYCKPAKVPRSKRNPLVLSSKTPLPLSGSWTNPNPPARDGEFLNKNDGQCLEEQRPECDPLEGPVQEVIQYPNEDQIVKSCEINSRSDKSNVSLMRKQIQLAKCSKSTQCNMFSNVTFLSEALLRTELPELKRPKIAITRGVGLSAQSKAILWNVFNYFKLKKKCYNLVYNVSDMTESATGVRSVYLLKLMRDGSASLTNDSPLPSFKASSQKRGRMCTSVSNMHMDTALRRCIHEHFLTKKAAPNLHVLQKHMNKNYPRALSNSCIRKRMKEMGFTGIRTNRKRIQIEGTPIRSWRYEYLDKLKACVQKQENIVFTIVVHLRAVAKASWEVLENLDRVRADNRVLTVFQAADKNGLIDESFFLNETVTNPKNLTCDEYFFEWLELHLLKKIPIGSAVVLAHNKYHKMMDSVRKPNAGSPKEEVVDWLRKRVIGHVDETLPKCVLLGKVGRFPVKQTYQVDSLVETYGHTAIHLASSQKDLNPLEYVWEDIRVKLVDKVKLNFDTASLKRVFRSTKDRLKTAYEEVRQQEDFYRLYDPLLEDAQETAIQKLGGLWSPPTITPDDTCKDEDAAVNGEDDRSSDSDSSDQSCSTSTSSSDSDSEAHKSSDSNDSSSDDPEDSEDSEDDTPLSESDKPLPGKRRKME